MGFTRCVCALRGTQASVNHPAVLWLDFWKVP